MMRPSGLRAYLYRSLCTEFSCRVSSVVFFFSSRRRHTRCLSDWSSDECSSDLTATVLAHAIIREGAKSVAAGMNPMDLKRGIDLAVEAVVEHLKANSKKVTSNEEIAQVGTISANGDAEIGKFLADAMKKVGNEGVITVEEAKSLETELDVVEGMQFDRGYISPYFITNADKMRVEVDDD